MSAGEPRRPLTPRAAAVAAALWLFAGTAFAQVVEVPRIDATIGSGSVGAAPSAAAPIVAPSLSAVASPSIAPSAAPIAAAPVLAPALSISAAGAIPALPAAAAAPQPVAAAPALAGAPALAASGGGFGKRVTPPGAPGAAATPVQPSAGESLGGESEWANSSALFDLSADRGAGPVSPAISAGLPGNPAGQVLGRLRRAAKNGQSGPGQVPGMERVEWAGLARHGNSGETTQLSIDGKTWWMKRIGNSTDKDLQAIPRETRASNEAGVAAVLRSDPQLSRSFSVTPRVSTFRDGDHVYVLTEGLPTIGNGESQRQDLTPVQRADAAIIQLILGLGDMHGGDVLPLGGGRFGLIDFEKLSRAPMRKATPQEIDNEVMFKNFPLVDRLSDNDPAVYQRRFKEWMDDYRNGGRARMDRELAGQGWSRAQRQVYLETVDKNAETYLDRLQPYLDYANERYRIMLKARAEAARPPPQKEKKGLFGWGK
jgi:hypothetical protein